MNFTLSHLFSYLVRLAGLTLAYFFLAKLSLEFFAVDGIICILWPCSGLALAALLIGGKKYWPSIFVGEFLVGLLLSKAASVSILIALGNTFEVFIAAWLLTGIARIDTSLNHPHDWGRMALVAAIASSISALIGVPVLRIGGFVDTSAPLFDNVLHWWQGNFLGILLVTPLILIWRRFPSTWLDRRIEAIAFVCLALLAGQIIFLGWLHELFASHAKAFLMFVFVVWGALRFGKHGVLLLTTLTAILALTGAILNIGYFGSDLAATHLFNFWLYMLTLTVVGMMLSLTLQSRTDAEMSIRQSEERLKRAELASKSGNWELHLDTQTIIGSVGAIKLYGLAQNSLNFSYIKSIALPEYRVMLDAALNDLIEHGKPYDVEFKIKKADTGEIIDIHSVADFDRERRILFGVIQDITARKRTEEELLIAAATFDSHEAILITDALSNIIRVNHAFTEITGYSADEVLGQNPRMMSSGRHDREFYIDMWQRLLHEGVWAGEIWDRRKNGHIYPKWMTITAIKNERQETTRYVAIFSDITARKQAEEEIRNLAFYDALTKLPNRRLFLDRLNAALPASARHNNYGAVLFIDLDRFKTINDTLGHECGDILLKEVGIRIKSCVREMDTVARFGGDEFVVLLEALSDELVDASHNVALVAEKIREALAQPYLLKEHELYSSPSIGICLFHDTKESVEKLLEQADMAMYQAKQAGRNTVRFFDPVMQQNLTIHDTLENDLHHALALQQLSLHYQIQVDNENHPLGAEALLRWMHPEQGMLMPRQFIPLAEESSLIIDIGNWVLITACEQLALWSQNEKTRELTLTINISAKEFSQPDFVDRVAAILEQHHTDATRLKMELSEKLLMADIGGMMEKINALRNLGVKLAIDNFSTIYSSLSYLKQLSSDQFKIHQDFVQGINLVRNDTLLVQNIIDLAKSLDMNVFAEGVETEAQRAFLQDHDCTSYQGNLFSKPVSIGEFNVLLEKLWAKPS